MALDFLKEREWWVFYQQDLGRNWWLYQLILLHNCRLL
jgi:hypothetical protein